LSRDTWAVKVLGFPFVEGFAFDVAFGFLAHRPRLAARILRWKAGSTNHLSGHGTSDHDSLFRLPDHSGRQDAQSAQR
jgi:hypothetical protein